jgi:uncharacterized protein involved in outer membrane biogenesis
MTRRNLALAALAILVIALGVVFMVLSRADELVKRAIEEHGSAATQVAVRVEEVDIRLVATSASLRGLTVANPPGFSAEPAMRLDEVQVALDAASLGTDVLVLNAVTIVAPRVRFEVDANRRANINVLAQNVGRYGKHDAGVDAVGPTATPIISPVPVSRRADDQRILIKRLSITGGEVEIDATALGGKRRVVELPDTEVTGIGEDSGGATGEEVAEAVMIALISDVGTTVAATQVQSKIEEAVGGKAGKALGRGVGEAIKGLGGVLNDIIQ